MSGGKRKGDLPNESAGEHGPAVVLPSRWQTLSRLGGGAQAEVWLAMDRVAGERVAIKVVHPGATSMIKGRWIRELRLGMQLSHAHLIRIIDVLEVGDELVAVMEWAAGGNLAQRIGFAGPQPVATVVPWARHALGALAYLHDQDIVHRDVKASNLLLMEDGALKLSDLGLVGDLSRSEAPGVVGTRSHMPVEQFRGEAPQAWWDLHALGFTLHHLLTGALPPRGADGVADLVADKLLQTSVDGLGWVAELVDRLLEHRPGLRWENGAQALAALERLP